MISDPTNFPHRRDSQGLYQSTCPRCFVTVARSKQEAEMTEVERLHVCYSSFLAERGQLSGPASSLASIERPSPTQRMVAEKKP